MNQFHMNWVDTESFESFQSNCAGDECHRFDPLDIIDMSSGLYEFQCSMPL